MKTKLNTLLKVIATSAALLISLNAFSANKEIEFGFYKAIDVDTGEVTAKMDIRPDGTLNFNFSAPDFEMPAEGCNGQYKVVENKFISDLECPILFFSNVHVEIDITNVNPESIRSEQGAIVPVTIDLVGDEPINFKLFKVNSL